MGHPVIAAQRYYPSLLGLADSTRMGIISYDVDTAKQMEDIQAEALPFGELSLDHIKQGNPELS